MRLVMAMGVVMAGMAAAGEPVEFAEALISGDFTYPYGLAAADLDGDGDMDFTASDARDHNCLYWFENLGGGRFERHRIHRQPMPSWRLERHAIADFNGDGRPDVVIVENSTGDLRWVENPGGKAMRGEWPVHYMMRSDTIPGAYDVAVADLNGDGRPDVAASSWRRGNMFTWHENPGTSGALWKTHVIAENLAETRTVRFGDFDGDGDLDLLGTASGGGLVLWMENPGKAGGVWKQHVIDTVARPVHGEPADMDGDGDLDVVMAIGMGGQTDRGIRHRIVWYENLSGGKTWKAHVVLEPFWNAFEAVASDLDGDGDMDIVATAWNGKQGGPAVVWVENLGAEGWRPHVLKENWRHATQVIVVDLDGDGRKDVLAAAEDGAMEIRWWRNSGRK